jgi:hypothetical protein
MILRMGRVTNYAKNWLRDMEMSHPTAYMMAERLVNPELDESGEINIKNFVMLGFGAVIVGAFVPMGLNALNGAETANFTATELALYSIIGVAILIAVVMTFINIAS